MPTIKYIGSTNSWPELPYTGNQSVWKIAQQEFRSAAECTALLATGQFALVASPPVSAVLDVTGSKISQLVTGNLSIPINTDTANNIGVPGQQGFGVGICPILPDGYSTLYGTNDVTSPNYGNYKYTDGSILCWVPAYYFRLGHTQNPTFSVYGVNSIDIVPLSAFDTESAANTAGYYLHRAFVNNDSNQLGFFRDKYDNSLNGTIASSLPLGMPMVSGPGVGQTGFTGCTNNGRTPANQHSGSIDAAKSRGAQFFPESIFISDALTRISEAHGQASKSQNFCAWYDPAGTVNYPKGNNNNALKDGNDTTVAFITAGASSSPNMAQTGSGSPFAKTTHNGQPCGIADVNGNIFKINLGLTCVGSTKTITAATQTNPVVITAAAHGYTTGKVVQITGVLGMTQITDRFYTVTVLSADTFSLDGVDGTTYGAYTSGGAARTGTFYALKPSVDIAKVTSGSTLPTDHWGATGVSAQFDAVVPNFNTAAASNANSTRFGNGINAVFAMDTAANRALSMMGLPAAGGTSAAGTNAFGTDEFYQYIQDLLCVVSRGYWNNGGAAGVRNRYFNCARYNAAYGVGFACASYLT